MLVYLIAAVLLLVLYEGNDKLTTSGSIECNIQSSVKDFVFSDKKSLFVGKSEDCSS